MHGWTKERVKECVTNAAKELGYTEMKPEQLEVVATFIDFAFCSFACSI